MNFPCRPVISFQEEVLFHFLRRRRFVHAKTITAREQDQFRTSSLRLIGRMVEMEMIPITSSTRFCDYRVGRVYWNTVTDNIHQHNIHWIFTLNDGLWLMWDMFWSIFAWFKALILLSAKLPSWKLVFRITLTWVQRQCQRWLPWQTAFQLPVG